MAAPVAPRDGCCRYARWLSSLRARRRPRGGETAMRLDTLLDLAAERAPRATAIVDGEQRYSYAEWQARVQRVARGLAALGVGLGDRVVLCLRNREELATIHLACQRLGAITTPLNFRLAAGEIAYCIGDAAPRVVVYEASTADAVLAGRGAWGGEPALVSVDPSGDGSLPFAALLEGGAGARSQRGMAAGEGGSAARHDGPPEGRAAQPARRVRRGARSRRAEPLRGRRVDARRDAPLPHNGHALAAGDAAAERQVRRRARLRARRGAADDRPRADQLALPGAHGLLRAAA